MTDPLYELLSPHFPHDNASSSHVQPHSRDTVTPKYLSRLTTLPLAALATDEPTSLSQSTHSNLLSLQSLSARSNATIVASSTHLSSLHSTLPRLAAEASSLRHDIPKLDTTAVQFSDRYSRAKDANALLDRRKKALLIARNIDRVSDILDLPTLLASAIASSSSSSSSSSTTSTSAPATTAATNPSSTSTTSPSTYASALDLHSHIKRLHLLHPTSPLISSIYTQTESAMRDLTTNLLLSLRAPNIKLAGAMRTIGWLRRVAPDLDTPPTTTTTSSAPPSSRTTTTTTFPTTGRSSTTNEGSLGAIFLVSRLSHLTTTLEALSPLRDLADQETAARLLRQQQKQPQPPLKKPPSSPAAPPRPPDRDAWSHGQQTERYLKRYLEIFREQSFAIVAMYRSIFPAPSSSSSEDPLAATPAAAAAVAIPSALSTFPLHLTTALLLPTLKQYLPNVRDRAARESLLTQVLYAGGSLGRLGGECGMVVAEVGGEEEWDEEGGEGEGVEEEREREVEEWVAVMKKHRVLAGKLERMAAGGGGGGGVAGGGG